MRHSRISMIATCKRPVGGAQLVVNIDQSTFRLRSCRSFHSIMANTFVQIYLHLVFAVKKRESLIAPPLQPQIHAYAAEALRKRGHVPVAVGGTSDHIHILFKYNPKELIPDLVRDLKVWLSKLINDYRMCVFKFEWQKGYGCFSHSHSQIETVKKYILTQPQHHHNRILREEIKLILERQGIPFDERYIFEEPN